MTKSGVMSIVIASYRSGNAALEEAILRVDASPLTGVVWNIAAATLEEDPAGAASSRTEVAGGGNLSAEARDVLIRRLRDGADILAPSGYSGAPHGLLTAEELDRDIAWAERNPWDSGAKQITGAPVRVLMPQEADVRRSDGLEVYRRLVSRREKGLVDFPLVPLEVPVGRIKSPPRDWSQLLLRAIRRSSEEPSVFLLVVDTTPTPVLWMFDRLAELRRRGTEVQLRPFVDFDGRPVDVDAASLEPLHAPVYAPSDRHAWYRVAAHRGAASGDGAASRDGATRGDGAKFDPGSARNHERMRERLLLLRPRPFGGARPEAAPPPAHYGADRVLGSSMQGSATISDEVWDVHLTGGRLGAIRAGDAEIAGADTVRSRLRVAGKDLPFDSWGAVSFEGTRSRGLQEHLVLSAPFTPTPGSLIVEYYFVDGFSPLVLDLHTRYPVFEQGVLVDETAPFEYPLYMLGEDEALVVEATYPDGSRARQTYTASYEGFVYGQTFSFRKVAVDQGAPVRTGAPVPATGRGKNTGITLRAYDPDSSLIVGLALSVRPCRKAARPDGRRRRLCLEVRANLAGSYQELWSDEISCVEEHMTFLLTPGDRHALAIPGNVKGELAGPWAHERWE